MHKNSRRNKNIIHLDMDAFYASIEIQDNPTLKNKPVIVGGGKNRGVVSAASYDARKFGVHSAQPIITAMRLCPQGIYLPVRRSRYRQVSEQIFEIFRRFTPLVETLSLDEAFLDVSGSIRMFGSAETIAIDIKKIVLKETGLCVSAGIAPSKFIAKIASDIGKPNALTVVLPDQVMEFLRPLPIEQLWGVGQTTKKALKLLNVETIGDLENLSPDILKKKFGKHGMQLYMLSQGIDLRSVDPDREIKSVGNEETFMDDIVDMGVLQREILRLSEKVSRRLRNNGLKGRTITIKIKYADFLQVTRSATIDEHLDDTMEIYRICCELLKKTETKGNPVRLAGVSVSRFEHRANTRQVSLFNTPRVSDKKSKLNNALDLIYEKYGGDKIMPGTLLQNCRTRTAKPGKKTTP